jgi:hypothetical protein
MSGRWWPVCRTKPRQVSRLPAVSRSRRTPRPHPLHLLQRPRRRHGLAQAYVSGPDRVPLPPPTNVPLRCRAPRHLIKPERSQPQQQGRARTHQTELVNNSRDRTVLPSSFQLVVSHRDHGQDPGFLHPERVAGGPRGGHYATRLSWRTISGSSHTEQQPAGKAPKQEQGPETERKQQQQQREARPRFAPEFDGLNCFESIVSY